MSDTIPGPPADPSVSSALTAAELIAELEGFAQTITTAVQILNGLDRGGLPFSTRLIHQLPRGLTETWDRAIDLAAKARVNPPPKPEPPATVANYQTAAVRIAAWGREAADLVRRRETAEQLNARPVPGPPAAGGEAKSKNGKVKGKNIDARMLKIMAENAESHGWSQRRWGRELDCSASTVADTRTWTERLAGARALSAADAAARMDRTNTHPKGRRRRKPT